MKLKSLLISSAVALAVIVPLTPAQAHAQTSDINPWSQCGLGSAVFPTVPLGAIISNLIWDLGTTAVTSSAVSPETCKGTKMAAAQFVGSTYASLEMEAVIGEGQYQAALSNVMGCDQSVQAPLFAQVRTQFRNEVAQPEYSELSHNQKAEAYYLIVADIVETQYSAQCNFA